jgi:putative membrane protein (TIGR04086 family)
MFAFIILGGFICGAYVYKKVRGRGFLTGLLSTVPYSLLVFIVICIINGFTVSGDIFLVFLLALSGGFLGGVTAANTKI